MHFDYFDKDYKIIGSIVVVPFIEGQLQNGNQQTWHIDPKVYAFDIVYCDLLAIENHHSLFNCTYIEGEEYV